MKEKEEKQKHENTNSEFSFYVPLFSQPLKRSNENFKSLVGALLNSILICRNKAHEFAFLSFSSICQPFKGE